MSHRPTRRFNVLERFQLLRSAGFPVPHCGIRRLSSRLFRADETRDKNVPQTRRQECLRYIKVGTALNVLAATLSIGLWVGAAQGQSSNSVAGPDPREIPIPPIKTAMKPLPGVNELPVRAEMPDVLTMNDGTKVTTPKQWPKRREEMKRILEYYAV